jgi:spore coat polysaccharide biosynthesis protein SpsF
MDIAGQSMLARTVRRTQNARLLDDVIVATSSHVRDEAVASEARTLGVACLRGSETDVLARYQLAASSTQADTVVRITADCPLIDPTVVDLVVSSFKAALPHPSYASNTLVRTFPRGLDVEVIDATCLAQAELEARSASDREHVTPYIYAHPDRFRLLSVVNEQQDLSGYRWTVDTDEDLRFVRSLYERLPREGFAWQEVVALLQREPRLVDINHHVEQKVI